jgi:hypothetical protein
MRRFSFLLAAVAIGGVVLCANPSSAGPLASGLVSGIAAEFSDGLVQKVHGYHCKQRKGWYRGKRRWHRHARACRDSDYSYYPRYRRYPPLPYYASPFGPYYDEWQWERRNWLWD